MDNIISEKLKILAEGAKYDVSCSSSGSSRKSYGGQLGNTAACGICHSFTADGRCISLLKTLISNKCSYNCSYCASRCTADIARASFTPEELCRVVIGFYRRNYIEGLFLSSAVETSPNHTMQKLADTVYLLRTKYNFNGYIHLKGIPSASQDIIEYAAAYCDRMSFNIELPTESSLKLLAPQKSRDAIILPMQKLAAAKLSGAKAHNNRRLIPAGQTTQMIVGASPESDGHIIRLTEGLYHKFSLKRVYFSSYVPLNINNSLLPHKPASLIREHRLYQADWLLRFYGFSAAELLPPEENFPEEFDPKCWWALKNYHLFPVEINTAPLNVLLRVPGIGNIGAYKITKARKHTRLRFEDLKQMRVVLKRAAHFITCGGKFYGNDKSIDSIKTALLCTKYVKTAQLNMFDAGIAALTGQL